MWFIAILKHHIKWRLYPFMFVPLTDDINIIIIIIIII